MNGESIEIFILQIFIIFFLAKVFGTALERLKQPAVIGEIFVGILLGNIIIGHIDIYELLQLDPQHGGQSIYALAKIGVILLLFLIGLETKFSDLKKVGRTSILVAVLGVVFPFIFGFTIILSLRFGNFQAALFVGASMVATSVGITARLLQDLKKLHSREGRIIIGAAVIDDILGIIVLGIVGGTGLSNLTLNYLKTYL